MKQPTIAIIGAGAVGSTAAYACIMHINAKILLVDINQKRCAGEVDDLSDALSFGNATNVAAGSLQEAGQADIIVIAAGIPQKPGQSRLELLQTNKNVMQSLLQEMQPLNKQSIIIVVTNPVDILTRYVQESSGLPRQQIFGSGTLLDTLRLRGSIGEKISVDPRSINLFVIGEHGDSQCVAWSAADIGGVPLSKFHELNMQELETLAQQARQKAYDIINCKGFTSFGIAACIAEYCHIILGDKKQVVPVSCYVESLNACISMPAVLGKEGVENILAISLSQEEAIKLAQSALIVRNLYEQVTQS